jgi:hypothetical protein
MRGLRPTWREFPGVALWAPTQRTQVDFDLSVERDGKLLILEQKAPVYGARKADHHIQVDVGGSRGRHGQLWCYCTDERLVGLVWYVLPVPPYAAVHAVGRGSALLPDLACARVSGHRWGAGAPCEDWFYMVQAQDLYTWLPHRFRPGPGIMPRLPSIGDPQPSGLVGKRSFACADLLAAGPQHLMTLRQWAGAVKDCSVEGGLVKNSQIVHTGRLARDGEILLAGRRVNIPLDESPEVSAASSAAVEPPSRSPGSTRALFVPSDDIPEWR